MPEWRSKYRLSRLGLFMKVHRVPGIKLAGLTGVSRQHLYRLRHGQMEATLDMMRRLRDGCGMILNRRVWMSELFELGEDDVLLLLTLGQNENDRYRVGLVLRIAEETQKEVSFGLDGVSANL